MNMNIGPNSHTSSANVLTLEEKKRRLKKSIAKMMVFWVAHSRDDLHYDLIGPNPGNAWAGLALTEAFDSNEERSAFFNIASRVFNDEVETEVQTDGGERIKVKIKVVEEGVKRIRGRVHGKDGMTASPDPLPPEWEADLDPLCPGDPILNVMYRAAAAFVDSNNWP